MSVRLHQCELMVELLRQGPLFSHELAEAGIGRPNSRAAELRRRGFLIDCTHRREGYLYRLVAEPYETAVLEEAPGPAAGFGVSSSASLEKPPIPTSAAAGGESACERQESPAGSARVPGVGRPGGFSSDGVDLDEQLRLEQEYELLASLDGGES